MIRTKEYPYLSCDFEYFNPVQEACYPFFTEDCNIVVASSMSSGKSLIAECIFAYELQKKGSSKVCYVSPLKALTSEKYEDWINKSEFASKGVIQLSSDSYAYDEKISQHNIVLSTIEALDVKMRKKAEWIKSLRCFVFDEAHLLSHKKRGTDAEALVVGLSRLNPTCRIIFLSGTLENAKELAQWLKFINGKPTKFVKSDWTPAKIEKKYMVYDGKEEFNQLISNQVSRGKNLVFVHSKKLGERLVSYLDDLGYSVAFYHSDLTFKRRQDIANRFKSEYGDLDILVSTSALGMGINL